jgi:hypothetical protein
MQTHQQIRQKFMCSFAGCNKAYFSKRNLEQHENGVHRNKRYSCGRPGCNYKTSWKGNLLKHIKFRHSNACPAHPLSHVPTGRLAPVGNLAPSLAKGYFCTTGQTKIPEKACGHPRTSDCDFGDSSQPKVLAPNELDVGQSHNVFVGENCILERDCETGSAVSAYFIGNQKFIDEVKADKPKNRKNWACVLALKPQWQQSRQQAAEFSKLNPIPDEELDLAHLVNYAFRHKQCLAEVNWMSVYLNRTLFLWFENFVRLMYKHYDEVIVYVQAIYTTSNLQAGQLDDENFSFTIRQQNANGDFSSTTVPIGYAAIVHGFRVVGDRW